MSTESMSDLIARQLQVFAELAHGAPRPRRDQPGVTSYYDLAYATISGFRPLALDLHVPDGDGPFPIVVWIHGGGWLGGARSMGHAEELAQHGYAVAAVDYRLSGEAIFPAQLLDLKGAVRWLRASAATYRLDPQRIAGWGASAGAHLASMLALTAGKAEFEGDVGGNLDQSSALQCVVDYFVVSDLGALDSGPMTATPMPGVPRTMQETLLGYAPSANPDAARRAGPLSHVRPDAPPFLLIHGDVDPIIPPHHSRLLHEALRQAGADAELVELSGAVHEDPQFWGPDAQHSVRSFLDRTLSRSAIGAASV
jgi:acetyl esterase/lipase